MRVIGVDPGLARAGFAVVEETGGRLRALDHGTVHADPGEPADQLAALRAQLDLAITRHQPEAMSIERVFFSRNVRTAIRTAQASGVASCLAAERGMRVYEYGPLEVKRAVVGVGDATKEQVEFMVRRILGLREELSGPDAADALALAIALLHARPWALKEAVR